mmetsp:Transcript_44449/g.65966  ORF Transcript_44449/g.65966 Transcript_44449/m.65966 type:complete len:331 (+) Transcript_44449:312-1304(+)
MVATHSVYVSRECAEPGSSESSGPTCHNRVDHTHVVRVQIPQAGEIPVIIQKPDRMSSSNVIKERLVSLVRCDVNYFVVLPHFLRVFKPRRSRELHLLVLEFTSAYVHGTVATAAILVGWRASYCRFCLQSFDDLACRTIDAVVVVQEIPNEAFEVVVHRGVSESNHCIVVRQEPQLLVARSYVHEYRARVARIPDRNLPLTTKLFNSFLVCLTDRLACKRILVEDDAVIFGAEARRVSSLIQELEHTLTRSIALGSVLAMICATSDSRHLVVGDRHTTILASLLIQEFLHRDHGNPLFERFRIKREKVGESAMFLLCIGRETVQIKLRR